MSRGDTDQRQGAVKTMWSVLRTAWKVMVKRAIADRLILSAALITVLLATTLLAAGPIYSDAVTLAGLRRTLQDAPIAESNVEISVHSNTGAYGELADRIDREIQRAFRFTGGEVHQRATSDSYALPQQPEEGTVRNLAVFRTFDDFEGHATITEGRMPEETGGPPYEAVISQPAAEILDINVGDHLTVVNRRDDSIQPELTIVGLFSVNSPTDRFWYADALDTNGVDVGSSFTTYGPIVVPPQTFAAVTTLGVEYDWRVFPNIDELTVSEITGWRTAVAQLESRLNSGVPAGGRFRVETDLVRILNQADRSLLVTRSGVLLLTIQLAILAGYALFLTANLLASHREIETNLLRARGAGNRQIAALTLMEAFLLIVPMVILAPWAAALSLRLLNWAGPLADIDLRIEPVVTTNAYLLAIAAGIGAMVALAIPAIRASRAFANPRASRSRQESRALYQRAGIDLALLVIAGIALWQLRRFGAPISRNIEGRFGIDPLLVSAPALGLLAGAILALRTIPLLARVAERIASQRTWLAPALSAWQVARRPLTYARAALLLMLAIGIGLFAVSYTSTWRDSQRDQAQFQIGADFRIQPDQRTGQALPHLVLQNGYSQLPAYQESMGVIRDFGRLSRSNATGRFVILDAAVAPQIVKFRSDLSASSFSDLMQRLQDQRPDLATAPLDGEPDAIAINVQADIEPLSEDDLEDLQDNGYEEKDYDVNFSARLVLRDARGLLHRIEMGAVPSDGSAVRLEQPLTIPLTADITGAPLYPLSLVSIEFTTITPKLKPRQATITVSSIELGTGGDWQPAASTSQIPWEPIPPDLALAYMLPTTDLGIPPDDGGLVLEISTGSIVAQNIALPVTLAARPAGSHLPTVVPAIVTQRFLDLNQLAIGDTFPLTGLRGPSLSAEIAGVVNEFPTIDPGSGEAIIFDLPTYQTLAYTPGQFLYQPEEYWIETSGGNDGDFAQTLLDQPFSSREVLSLDQRQTSLLSDPVALGTIGALMLGFIAASIFAAVGFIVSAAIAARERLTEFALLRAVGLSAREMVSWLSLEHGVLIVTSLVGGTLLGLGLSWIILPLIAITQEAREAVPGVIVSYPWLTIVSLELGMLLVLLIAVGVLVIFLRRVGLGSLLRMGGE